MKYRLRAINLGTTVLDDKSKFTYFQHFGEKLKFPFIAWLIEGNGRRIVVDSGPGDPTWAKANLNIDLQAGPQGNFVESLAHLGVESASVEWVICTHLHWDHCFNHCFMPNATFVVQRAELVHAVDPIPCQTSIYGWGMKGGAPFTKVQEKYKTVKGDAEIAPGIQLISTPGHTPGSQGVLVDTGDGPVLLAGDTIPLYENWETKTPSGIHVDLESYYDTFERIKSLHVSVIVPGHDLAVLTQERFWQ